MKTPLNVALQKTEVENLLLPQVILTSRKEKLLFCSKSNLNFIFCIQQVWIQVDNYEAKVSRNDIGMH